MQMLDRMNSGWQSQGDALEHLIRLQTQNQGLNTCFPCFTPLLDICYYRCLSPSAIVLEDRMKKKGQHILLIWQNSTSDLQAPLLCS